MFIIRLKKINQFMILTYIIMIKQLSSIFNDEVLYSIKTHTHNMDFDFRYVYRLTYVYLTLIFKIRFLIYKKKKAEQYYLVCSTNMNLFHSLTVIV